MSHLTQILRNFQITVPKTLRERFKMKEGDLIKIEETNSGILMTPVETIDRSQAWFWSKEWQDGEKEVEKEKKRGKTKRFDDIQDFIKDLKK